AVIRAQHLVRVPDGLAAAVAAPLCCAGWTAYGALREAGAADSVAIFGMGGLGHLAVQYARYRGLRVAAADVSEEKLEQARSLGAEVAVLADGAGRTLQKSMGGVDAAVVLTASPAAIQQAFRAVKRTGTVVLVGLAATNYELPIVDTVLKGIRIQGSYLGTRHDLEDVMRLGATGKVRPHVETFPLEEAPRLLEALKQGKLLGRAVVTF
ncbi:MAG: zinc-binding dehydrogenase, partial [Acidobacteria bacterium]|nr:zinc-binding dehydrogenase [Acidobacteriota bacterium]